jgi:hypothetical protein
MYKFIRTNEGPLRGCYHHANFERNRFDLIEKINRTDGDQVSGSDVKPAPARRKPANIAAASSISAAAANKSSSIENTTSGSEIGSDDGEFELFDFENDSSPDFVRARPEEGKPSITMMSRATTRSASLAATMSKMISKEPGLFDLQQDAPSASALPSTNPHLQDRSSLSLRHSTASFYSQRPSPSIVPNIPQDIVEEIIKTFGSTTIP